MTRELKMLILKLVFSPLWVLTLLIPLVYIFLYGFDKDLKELLKDIFEYWRL